MKRRDVMKFAGASVFFTPIMYNCSLEKTALNSRHLVETPEKRIVYLSQMLKVLCTDLGPHPMGSPEFNKAVQIVEKEMKQALPIVELDTFTVDYWVMRGEPELYVGDQRLEAYPRIETAGTPPNGVSGILNRMDNKGIPYGVVDRSSGEIRGYITPYGGKARPLYASGEELKRIPTFTVGNQDVPLLEKAIENETTIHVRLPIDVIPNTPTSNVVGILPGESKDEIVFLAHLDTVYASPGANDNTASLVVMLMLAHAVSGTHPKKKLTFIATTGEERGGFRGATHYVEKRKKEGTLKNIKFVVNFDSGTWSPDIEIWSEDEELQDLIQAIDRDLNVNGTPQRVNKTGFSLDARPFQESGARAIYVESNGPDKIHIWHRPLDTPENVPGYTVEICFQLFHEFIKRVQDM
ncbi:MAG TPA: M28 family metallopeptidase [Anaerolineae bacterium]|nr:M28 family metallopeptidase [Anaerolineae bacterium]